MQLGDEESDKICLLLRLISIKTFASTDKQRKVIKCPYSKDTVQENILKLWLLPAFTQYTFTIMKKRSIE